MPTLAAASVERQTENLKAFQLSVWDEAARMYQANFSQLVYVGWMFGDGESWSTTADAYAPGRYLRPENTALLYVGYTGQADFLRASTPEILATLVPLQYVDGNLTGDPSRTIVRSVTSPARGHKSAPQGPYARQFNYATEGRFMHSAHCAATQYLAALGGKFDYAARCLGTVGSGLTLPTPRLCQMVGGKTNADGIMMSPRPVPLDMLRDEDIDPDAFHVIDVQSIPEGVELHGDAVKTVPQTRTWRIASGHVRAIYHRYGDGDGASDFRPVIDVCISTR
jgi:hypothetical protein